MARASLQRGLFVIEDAFRPALFAARSEQRMAKSEKDFPKDEHYIREHYCRTSERASGEDQRSHDGLQARAD
jgi:hypothetical protein